MVLSLETSGDVCSVALHEAGNLLWLKELHEKQAHASKLALLVKEALNSPEASGALLEAVAVSSGPGSYTGLRIGTSTAKGICYAKSIPLLSVGTLEIMAASAKKRFPDITLCPMIDARRMEVYAMLIDENGDVVQTVEAMVIDEQSYGERLAKSKVLFFGNGAIKCKGIISSTNAIFEEGIFPSARELGELVTKKLQLGLTEDLTHFEPFYLKEFMAKKPSRSLI